MYILISKSKDNLENIVVCVCISMRSSLISTKINLENHIYMNPVDFQILILKTC